MHLKTEMKQKVGKEPEGGSKKRKEVGNESPLASISASLMSVEDVPAIVNIKTLKGRLIAHKFNTGWSVGVVKSVEMQRGDTASRMEGGTD